MTLRGSGMAKTATTEGMQLPEDDREWKLHVEICRIELWRGYLSSSFVALPVDGPDGVAVIEPSSNFNWRGSRTPDSQEARLAHYELVSRLKGDGWTPTGQGDEWYQTELSRPTLVAPEEDDALFVDELDEPLADEPALRPVAVVAPPEPPPPPVVAEPLPEPAADAEPELEPEDEPEPAVERPRTRDRWQLAALVGLAIAICLILWVATH
jgi:hypothetical protein